MAELVRAIPMSDVPHPLVDQVGESGGRRWSLTESRARIVLLDDWHLDLLGRVVAADRQLVLATDERSALTPAFAEVWREAGAHWLVRDPVGGLRDGFTGRPVATVGDLWSDPGPADQLPAVAVRHLDRDVPDAWELSAVVAVRLPARGSSLLGGAVSELAAALGTAPRSWGSREPGLRAWDRDEITRAVRERMPGPVRLVVRGPRLAAVVVVRRTRHGVEETTYATLAAVGGDSDLRDEVSARTGAALARLAGSSMPLVGLVLGADGRSDLLRPPVLRSPTAPLALLVGAPTVRELRLDPAAEHDRSGAEVVGRAKLPALLHRFPVSPSAPLAGWPAFESVLRGLGGDGGADVLGAAAGPLGQVRPAPGRPVDGGDGA